MRQGRRQMSCGVMSRQCTSCLSLRMYAAPPTSHTGVSLRAWPSPAPLPDPTEHRRASRVTRILLPLLVRVSSSTGPMAGIPYTTRSPATVAPSSYFPDSILNNSRRRTSRAIVGTPSRWLDRRSRGRGHTSAVARRRLTRRTAQRANNAQWRCISQPRIPTPQAVPTDGSSRALRLCCLWDREPSNVWSRVP